MVLLFLWILKKKSSWFQIWGWTETDEEFVAENVKHLHDQQMLILAFFLPQGPE